MAETNAGVSVAEAQVRRRQKLILFGVLAAVCTVAVGLALLSTPTRSPTSQKAPETKPIQIGGGSMDKESFTAQFRAEQERLRRELLELQQWKNAQEKRDTKRDEPGASRPPAVAATLPPPLPPPPAPPPPGPAQRPTAANAQPVKPSPPPGPALKVLSVAAAPVQSAAASTARATARARETGETAPPEASVDNYVPSGSFARAVLLNGLDAPTGGNAHQNPHPVLLQLLDDATLPNQFRSRLQSCFVTASGYGDISSERAFVRLDRLSCVDEQGGAVDIKVQGYVAGEDGKTGMRGRLVTKSGQVLANALLTGLLSGIGKGIQAESTQQNTTIAGAVTTQVTNPWRAGLGEGIGKAMEEVSRYYLRLADKIFPIVEVDAGRVVDVVITRGVSIERR